MPHTPCKLLKRDLEEKPAALTEITAEGIQQQKLCPDDLLPTLFSDAIFAPH